MLLVLRQSPDVPHVGLKPIVLCYWPPESVSEDGVADMHHLVQLILVVFGLLLRQGLLIWRPGRLGTHYRVQWPQTHGSPPTSASQMLGLQMYAPMAVHSRVWLCLFVCFKSSISIVEFFRIYLITCQASGYLCDPFVSDSRGKWCFVPSTVRLFCKWAIVSREVGQGSPHGYHS